MKMLDFPRLLFIYSIINCITIVALVSINNLPNDNLVVNINKGYTLQRFSTYSPTIAEQVVHTFLSLDSFCSMQKTDAVCQYTSSSTATNIIELATMIPSRHSRDAPFNYERESVSKSIAKDLSRILVQHKPDEFLREIKSNVHYINNEFFYQNAEEKALDSTTSENTAHDNDAILRFRPTPVDIIMKQINNNQISFQYLSRTDLKSFLTTVFSYIDDSYVINDVEKSLHAFSQLILGQSVYAFRHCALNRQNSLSLKPCLLVSTLFLRIPANSLSIYSVYRLLPLPIVVGDDKYIYSNLPQVIGINAIDQTFIMWQNELEGNECTFTPVTLCRNKPILLSLSKSSCVSQLLADWQSDTSLCQVSRSLNTEQGIFYIDNGLWLIYNMYHTHDCQVYSTFTKLTETISINEAAIMRLPCDKTVTCPNFQLPTTSCQVNRVIVTPSFTFNTQNRPHFIMPIKNMTEKLVLAHHIQMEKATNELLSSFSSRTKLKGAIRDFGLYILYIMSSMFVMIFIYFFKLIKGKLLNDVQDLRSQIEDIVIL